MEITLPSTFTLVAYILLISLMIVFFAVSCLCSYVDRRWQKEMVIPLQRLMEACQPQPSDDSEYFAVAVIRMEDEPVHTDTHPFCEDDSCPCRSDGDRISKYISEPFNNGLLTNAEVVRMYNNKHIA